MKLLKGTLIIILYCPSDYPLKLEKKLIHKNIIYVKCLSFR